MVRAVSGSGMQAIECAADDKREPKGREREQ